MKEVLNFHNRNHIDVELICSELELLGWEAEYSCGISRTRVLSNASISTASSILEKVTTEPCVNCGCNPLIESEEVA